MSTTSQSVARRIWIAVLALFVILPILAFPEIIFGRQTLVRSDISMIHYPYHIMVADEWLSGRVPLWNPYQHIGIPLTAEGQVSALYPLGVLFLSPLSPSIELSLFILLHFVMALVFTFALARCLGMGTASSVVAGLGFGMGGFLMAQVPNVNIMTGAAWLPLVLCGVVLALRRRSWLIGLLAGVALAMQALTAQPQVVFYTLATVVGYGVYRIAADVFSAPSKNRQLAWQAVTSGLLVVVIIVSGLLLASPQLLPTFELQQLSVRSEDKDLAFLTENSLAPTLWLNLLMPSAFGNRLVGFKTGDIFEESFIYAGFIPLVLLFFSWGQRKRRDLYFFYLLLAAGVLLAMGGFTPLYEYVIQYLPGFSLFRIPARWLMVVNLSLAVLAGFGLETLLQKGLSRRQIVVYWLAALAILGVLVFGWAFRTDLLGYVDATVTSGTSRKLLTALLNKSFSINPIYQERLLMRWVMPLNGPAVLLIFNMVVTGVLFSLYAAGRLGSKVFSILLIAVVSLDLVVAGGTSITRVKPDSWWHQMSGGGRYVIENLDSGRVFPLGMGSPETAINNLGQFYPSAYGIHSAGGHGSPLMLARQDTFLHEADPVQMIQVLGVRYILTEGQMGSDVESVYPQVFNDDMSFVYENKNWLPRAFAVHNLLVAKTPTEALSHFQTRQVDPAQTVVLELTDGAPSAPAPEPASGSVATVVFETPQLVEIGVSMVGDGYLVLLDTYYPGWRATVDGQEVPIYRADYVARAVFVPAGEHSVRFEYRPMSFRLGLWLAAAVLVLIAVVAVRRFVPGRSVFRQSGLVDLGSEAKECLERG